MLHSSARAAGRTTTPIRLEEAKALGLPVSDAVTEPIYELMNLYPRRSQRRPSVEFIPTPYRTKGRDE